MLGHLNTSDVLRRLGVDLDKLTIQIQSRALTIASDFSRYAENVGEARVFEPLSKPPCHPCASRIQWIH
jgi:hypothetical protein